VVHWAGRPGTGWAGDGPLVVASLFIQWCGVAAVSDVGGGDNMWRGWDGGRLLSMLALKKRGLTFGSICPSA